MVLAFAFVLLAFAPAFASTVHPVDGRGPSRTYASPTWVYGDFVHAPHEPTSTNSITYGWSEVHTYFVAASKDAPAVWVHNVCTWNNLDMGRLRAAARGDQSVLGGYKTLQKLGYNDSHHIIQDAAMRGVPNYSSKYAPAIGLRGPSNVVGTEHYFATRVQATTMGGGTYGFEHGVARQALSAAGKSPGTADAALGFADEYFGARGVTPSTATRVPGNRPR